MKGIKYLFCHIGFQAVPAALRCVAFEPMPFTIDVVVAVAAAVLAGGGALWLFHRNRTLRSDVQRLEQRAEKVADRNWELKERRNARAASWKRKATSSCAVTQPVISLTPTMLSAGD